MNRAAKAAAAMFLYAAVMVAGGVAAYAMAPEGANARTALIVPVACAGAMVLSAILALQVHRQVVVGRIGLTLGLVLPLVFAVVIGFRAVKTGGAVTAYREARAAYEAQEGADPSDAAARAAFFESRGAPDHDKSYLRNVLWVLTAASAGAFALVLAKRPRAEDLATH